jgi:hypothetical protein
MPAKATLAAIVAAIIPTDFTIGHPPLGIATERLIYDIENLAQRSSPTVRVPAAEEPLTTQAAPYKT